MDHFANMLFILASISSGGDSAQLHSADCSVETKKQLQLMALEANPQNVSVSKMYDGLALFWKKL